MQQHNNSYLDMPWKLWYGNSVITQEGLHTNYIDELITKMNIRIYILLIQG